MKKMARQTVLQITGLWFILRVLTGLAITLFSPLFEYSEIERTVAFWPPAGNILVWLNRVLLAPWFRWDAVWFKRILTEGYIADNGTTSFHPLYPWFSWPLYRLGLDPGLSLLITSSLAALALFLIFYRLAALDLEPVDSWTALLLLATSPVAFILFAPYTESLFLLGTVLALYSMRQKRWGLVALFSFLATLTRQQGLFLSIPLAWWAWEASGKSLRGFKKAWPAWLATLAAPAALVVFAIYRIAYLHEGHLDFSSFQALIYSAIFSRANYKVVVGQAFRLPWDAMAIAISKIVHTGEINVIFNLLLGLGFAAAFILAWKHMNIAYRLYSITIVVISFSFTTGDIGYMSLPRHLFVALPVFIGLAVAVRKPWQKQFLIASQLLVMMFLMLLYVLTSWIP
jgi:hypothetical protein